MSEFKVGLPVSLAGRSVRVSRLLAPNAGPMTGPGTNTYLIGDRQLALVDPGPLDESHVDSILAAIAGRELRWILVTHTHADHSPAAAVIASHTGAELVGLVAPDGGRHDRSFQPARQYRSGELLAGHDFSVELIHTPGHVSNHFCYLIREESMLFTGDHILQGTTSVILPPDGDMADYMVSLRGLLSRQIASLAPGHGQLITDPTAAIKALIEHRTRREDKVLAALPEEGGIGQDALTLKVYDDVAPHLLPWARLTLEAHLIKLQREQRVESNPSGWRRRS